MCDGGALGKLLDVRLEALHEHVKQFHSNAPRHCASNGSISFLLHLIPPASHSSCISFLLLFAGAHAKVRGRIVGQDAVQQLQYALEHYSRCAQASRLRLPPPFGRNLTVCAIAGRSCCAPCATRDRHTP